MEDGSLQDRKLFCSQGSDGMTLDETGNVYLTGRGVSVYNRNGEKIRQIDVPESWTANVVFGGKDRNLLFITASDSIYGLKMKVKGASAPRGEAALERLEEREFGQMPDGTSVREFTLRNRGGMEVRLMTLGATLTAIMVPDSHGKTANVIVGSDSLADYLKPFPAASVIGRYANRIGGARFEIDGTSHQLTANNAPNHIHGGRKGFASKVWDAEPLPAAADRAGVRLSCHSDDGEEGYPGKMTASVSYILDDQNRLHLQYEATSDKATIINLTNHAYFNLGGAGGSQFTDHELWIDALSYTEVDRHLIPTGTISPVAGTPLDFSSPKPIGRDMQKVTHPRARIYDHNYVIRRDEDGVTLIARAHESSSGRFLEVWTDQPGVQLYTGNPRGFCLETQNYPDAINHPHFPSPVLRPGEKYLTTTIFAFGSL
jgi:aldose 1-epimerase